MLSAHETTWGSQPAIGWLAVNFWILERSYEMRSRTCNASRGISSLRQILSCCAILFTSIVKKQNHSNKLTVIQVDLLIWHNLKLCGASLLINQSTTFFKFSQILDSCVNLNALTVIAYTIQFIAIGIRQDLRFMNFRFIL